MMLKRLITFLSAVTVVFSLHAQNRGAEEPLPYDKIPEHPETYSAGAVASRMVDGLGFRYYWVTEGLGEEDLKFRPGSEARSTEETIDHIYEMSIIIANAVKNETQGRAEGLTFAQKRAATLYNLKAVSDVLRKSTDQDLQSYQVRFGNGATFPFWNLINGPIADALWHCGQIVSFRRSSGNPFNSNVSLFNGKLRE